LFFLLSLILYTVNSRAIAAYSRHLTYSMFRSTASRSMYALISRSMYAVLRTTSNSDLTATNQRQSNVTSFCTSSRSCINCCCHNKPSDTHTEAHSQILRPEHSTAPNTNRIYIAPLTNCPWVLKDVKTRDEIDEFLKNLKTY